jgi:ornithine cyclodeaminase/alanine dehydrogenase-like protein (mu-crystallin family)
MTLTHIPFAAGDALLDWNELTKALIKGHDLPKAEIDDTFLYRGKDTLLSRSAWIDGMGIAVKSATVFPDNPARDVPMINGALCLFADKTGMLEALVDFHLVTKWKTVGDSLLAAKLLARRNSKSILIVGAGTVGRSVHAAFGSAFPEARFEIWNRSPAGAEAMIADLPNLSLAKDLEAAVRNADIIVSATMSTDPLIKGDWLQPGQHLNLIGAYRPDMREADDTALLRGSVFVDSFDTTIGHIGELKIPIEAGIINKDAILADYYNLDAFARRSDDEITVFKNGGGAHLDLMTSRYILEKWQASS